MIDISEFIYPQLIFLERLDTRKTKNKSRHLNMIKFKSYNDVLNIIDIYYNLLSLCTYI